MPLLSHPRVTRHSHGEGGFVLTSLQRFFAKSARERRSALLTLMVTPPVRVVLRRRGYTGTVRSLTRIPRSPASGLDQAVADARIAQSVIRRLPFDTTCLERSLVLWWLVGGSEVGQ